MVNIIIICYSFHIVNQWSTFQNGSRLFTFKVGALPFIVWAIGNSDSNSNITKGKLKCLKN